MANRKSSQNPPSSGGGKQTGRNFNWLWILILAILLGQLLLTQFGNRPAEEITWTQFKRQMLADQEVAKITVVNKEKAEVYIKKSKLGQGDYAEIDTAAAGPHYVFNIGSLENFETTVQEAQDELPSEERLDIAYEQRTDWWGSILSWVIPIVLFIGLWLFIINRARPSGMGGGRGIFDFGKAGDALKEEKTNITFNDVAGMEEVKLEVTEIVDLLKNPQKYTRLGAKIPKGIILIGPPGTGKTLLAKAVAGEADVPFFSMSGSEFVEMFVGVGASRVRDLFKKAKQSAPSIIFIDEIDAIGRSRGQARSFQQNDERENTLNQLLTEMDGFGTNTGVIVLAATNKGEVLDRALLRPGRFDRQIYLELPNRNERQAIFEVHLQPLRLADDINPETLAGQTPGFSGADIANVCNEAALIAARRDEDRIDMKAFFDAMDRVIAGLEKKSKIISEEERKVIAYHEAGHATASWHLPEADNLIKVSIVPRGKSLGAAWYLPQENQLYTREQLVDRLCSALGGRASEEVVFGKVTSGALDDLEKVTKQAYMMVAYYGLDQEFGNRSFYDSTGRYEQSLQKPYSEATAKVIDDRVDALIEEAYEKTKTLLREHREELDELAHRLMEHETVFKKDLEEVFGKRVAQSG